jgi:hypothetical protein
VSTSASGLAGNRPSTPFASALDADERPSIRQVLQTVLEGPASKHWEQRLQENPSLAAALTSALAATLEEFTTGAPTPDAKSPSRSADQRASREPRPNGDGVNATPEAAPEWQTDRKPARQDKPHHDKRESPHSSSNEEASTELSRPSDRANAEASEAAASTRTKRKARNQPRKANQGKERLSQKGTDSQSPDTSVKHSVTNRDHNPSRKRKQTVTRSLVEEVNEGVNKGSGHNSTNGDPGRQRLEFTPTPQSMLPQYACLFWGRRIMRTAHPEGKDKIGTGPCGKCDACVGYRKYTKMEQYAASQPSPVSTVLECLFRTIAEAYRFADLPAHRRRVERVRRYTGFSQPEVNWLENPWLVRIIWDAPANGDDLDLIKQHAEDSGAESMSLEVRPVTPAQFMNWLPDRFSLKKPEGGLIILCRFSNNWAHKVEEPRSWRNGLTRTVKNPPMKEGNLQPTQSPRAKAITESWKLWYKESKNPKSTPELRQTFEEETQRRLDRARYVELTDWMHRWEILQPDHIVRSKEFIDAYVRGEKPSAREWQEETLGPKGLVVEVARWLKAEREPAPAIMMVAARLGYIAEGPVPTIDPAFLSELTATLPPLEFVDEPPRAA